MRKIKRTICGLVSTGAWCNINIYWKCILISNVCYPIRNQFEQNPATGITFYGHVQYSSQRLLAVWYRCRTHKSRYYIAGVYRDIIQVAMGIVGLCVYFIWDAIFILACTPLRRRYGGGVVPISLLRFFMNNGNTQIQVSNAVHTNKKKLFQIFFMPNCNVFILNSV